MPIIQIKIKMKLRRNIRVGNSNFFFKLIILFFLLTSNSLSLTNKDLEGNITQIKVLDKISSKNVYHRIKNGEQFKFKDLLIKSIKCKNSEFDDDPEITAYIQVKDLSIKSNDEVFVFNGWMFSSSPSINPFDHPVYDVWLTSCY